MNERCIYCYTSLGTGDIDGMCYTCREKQKENTVDFKLYKQYRALGTPEEISKKIESLQAQLTESRERERAAVHDIELVLNGAGVCHVCANGDCKDGEHCEPKWRGPAGEGEENGK